jgi:DNA-binding transcriptional LysR family regulator
MDLDPKFLKTFRAVAERGSFTAAGKMLGMTQSGVSQYVRALEKELGTTLLIRSNKLVGLTPAGEIFLQSARQILDQLERARTLVRDYSGRGGGRLRIGAPAEICGLLSPIIAELRRQLPRTELLVKAAGNATNHERLAAWALDFALMHSPVRHRSVAMVQAGRDELVLLVRGDHPLANAGRVGPAELQQQPLIAPLRKAEDQSLLDDFLIEGGVFPKVVAETDSVELSKRLVMEGFGLTVVPRWAARTEVEKGQLAAVSLGRVGLWRKWYIAYPQAHVPGGHGQTFVRVTADRLSRILADGARGQQDDGRMMLGTTG